MIMENTMTPAPMTDDLNAVMSVKDWVITQIILMLPIVGLIMALVWAFSDDTNKNKKNLMLAYLVITAVMLGIFIVFGILFSIL